MGSIRLMLIGKSLTRALAGDRGALVIGRLVAGIATRTSGDVFTACKLDCHRILRGVFGMPQYTRKPVLPSTHIAYSIILKNNLLTVPACFIILQKNKPLPKSMWVSHATYPKAVPLEVAFEQNEG